MARSRREALRGRATAACCDFRCAACRCLRWLYHAAHIMPICGTATSAGWLSSCGARALSCSGLSKCDLLPLALHVCGSAITVHALIPPSQSLSAHVCPRPLAPPACPAEQLAHLVVQWITLQAVHSRLLSKWSTCLEWMVQSCKTFKWLKPRPARGQRRARSRFRPLLRLAPVTVGALEQHCALKCWRGDFCVSC